MCELFVGFRYSGVKKKFNCFCLLFYSSDKHSHERMYFVDEPNKPSIGKKALMLSFSLPSRGILVFFFEPVSLHASCASLLIVKGRLGSSCCIIDKILSQRIDCTLSYSASPVSLEYFRWSFLKAKERQGNSETEKQREASLSSLKSLSFHKAFMYEENVEE